MISALSLRNSRFVIVRSTGQEEPAHARYIELAPLLPANVVMQGCIASILDRVRTVASQNTGTAPIGAQCPARTAARSVKIRAGPTVLCKSSHFAGRNCCGFVCSSDDGSASAGAIS
jgi:hypothetical protein